MYYYIDVNSISLLDRHTQHLLSIKDAVLWFGETDTLTGQRPAWQKDKSKIYVLVYG